MTTGGERETVIAGLGNLLLRDDGVGVHAAWELSKAPLDGIEVLDVGTAVFHGVAALGAARRVLAIDAMTAGGEPGTLYLLRGSDTAPAAPGSSIHAMGFCAALRFASEQARTASVIILGIEPAEIRYSMDLSPALVAGLPRLVASARRIAEAWDRTEQPLDEFMETVCKDGSWTEVSGKWRRT